MDLIGCLNSLFTVDFFRLCFFFPNVQTEFINGLGFMATFFFLHLIALSCLKLP